MNGIVFIFLNETGDLKPCYRIYFHFKYKKQNLLAETKGNVQTVLFWNFSVEFSNC